MEINDEISKTEKNWLFRRLRILHSESWGWL